MKKSPSQKIISGRYIDPLSDFGFKLIFGSEKNKDLLIDFLNELLRGRKLVVDLVYGKNEQPGPQFRFRKVIFDLTCTDANGAQFIIELQRVRQQFFKDRIIYYASTLIQDQAPKGKRDWDFNLKEVYLVAVMDFAFDDSSPETSLHRVHLADEASDKVFYEKLKFIFIEMPNFRKMENDLKSGLDKWLYALKNMSNLDKIPVFLDTEIFQKLFDVAEVSKLSKEQYMQYTKSRMAQWDEYAILKTAREEGVMEGNKEGFEKGNKEGFEKGIEIGIEKGQLENKTAVVKKLISKLGMTDAQAAEIAGASISFVKNIRRSLKK